MLKVLHHLFLFLHSLLFIYFSKSEYVFLSYQFMKTFKKIFSMYFMCYQLFIVEELKQKYITCYYQKQKYFHLLSSKILLKSLAHTQSSSHFLTAMSLFPFSLLFHVNDFVCHFKVEPSLLALSSQPLIWLVRRKD